MNLGRSLPPLWVEAAVGDVALSIDYGYTASAKNESDGPRFLRITDIQDGRVDWSQVPGCSISAEDLGKYRLAPGDLVFARTGATTGKSFLISKCPDQSVFASYLIRVRSSAHILAPFIAYFFQSASYWRQIAEQSIGTAQPGVNATRLRALRIRLAPYPEQHRIVEAIESYLTRLDDAVATLERVQRNLERYRASVLKAAVEGRLVPTEAELAKKEGRDYEPANVLLDRILEERRRRWIEDAAEKGRAKAEEKAREAGRPWTVEDDTKALEKERARSAGKYKEPAPADPSELPDLPEGWLWTTVEQITYRMVGGCSPSKSNYRSSGFLAFNKGNIKPYGQVRFDQRKYVEREYADAAPDRWIHSGATVATLRDLSQKADFLGLISEYAESEPALLTQGAVLLHLAEGFEPRYLHHLSNAPYYRKIVKERKHGSTQVHLRNGDFLALPVPLCPRSEQSEILNQVEYLFSTVDHIDKTVTENLNRLSCLRQTILKWAFEGKLVDQDPTDEPAPALLERISAERAVMESTKKANSRKGRKRTAK